MGANREVDGEEEGDSDGPSRSAGSFPPVILSSTESGMAPYLKELYKVSGRKGRLRQATVVQVALI